MKGSSNCIDDQRVWLATDRADEFVSLSRPLPGVEVMSVRGSDRRWCDFHLTYVAAFVDEEGPPVGAIWRYRSQTYTTTNGGFFLLPPNSEHRTLDVLGKGNFSVLRFDPETLGSAQQDLQISGRIRFEDPARRDRSAFLTMASFVSAVARRASELALECSYVETVGALLTRLGDCSVYRPSDGLCHHGVRAVCAHLRSNLTERTKLADLASLARMSPFGLCQAFRTRLGMSPGRYWSLCRLARGRQMVQEGAIAKLVAAELGFSDEAQFNRMFKRTYGAPPGRWARMSRANDWNRSGIADRSLNLLPAGS